MRFIERYLYSPYVFRVYYILFSSNVHNLYCIQQKIIFHIGKTRELFELFELFETA